MIEVKAGRWALSRIISQASDWPGGEPGFVVAAMRDRLAPIVEAYYPPMTGGVYALGFALVRLGGTVTNPPNADTTLLPNLAIDARFGDVTRKQRTDCVAALKQALAAYSYVDYDGSLKQKSTILAEYTNDTPFRQIILDVYEHLGHSDIRSRVSVQETHNTEYLDNFDTDPATRWTTEDGGFVYDATDDEMDITQDGGNQIHRYSANNPGSIEHESQVTSIGNVSRVAGGSVRHDSGGVNDCYCAQYRTPATNLLEIVRIANGSASVLASVTFTGSASPVRFYTIRCAAAGAAGANVSLAAWIAMTADGNKPADPGWYGVDGTPDLTYTDTAGNRLDDATHIQCGIAGQTAGSDGDTQHDYWKSRAISDRGGGGGGFQSAWAKNCNSVIRTQ